MAFQFRLDVLPGGLKLQRLGMSEQASEVIPCLSLLGFLPRCPLLGLADQFLVEQLPANAKDQSLDCFRMGIIQLRGCCIAEQLCAESLLHKITVVVILLNSGHYLKQEHASVH